MKYLVQYLPTLNSISLHHAWDINTKTYPKEYVDIIPVPASFHFASDYYLGPEQPHTTIGKLYIHDITCEMWIVNTYLCNIRCNRNSLNIWNTIWLHRKLDKIMHQKRLSHTISNALELPQNRFFPLLPEFFIFKP